MIVPIEILRLRKEIAEGRRRTSWCDLYNWFFERDSKFPEWDAFRRA